jgi:predicted anti-sigma-YlaC factor YlaD
VKDKTMKCTEIRELLPELATGVAAPPEVHEHVRSCANCAGMLDEFRKTMALLDEWQAPEPSPYFDTRLHARLREEATQPAARWFAWARRPVLAVSLGLALVAGALFIQNDSVGPPAAALTPGTAVSDLQVLDKNHDLLSDSDPDSAASVLDDMQVQPDVNANP